MTATTCVRAPRRHRWLPLLAALLSVIGLADRVGVGGLAASLAPLPAAHAAPAVHQVAGAPQLVSDDAPHGLRAAVPPGGDPLGPPPVSQVVPPQAVTTVVVAERLAPAPARATGMGRGPPASASLS